MLIRYPGFFTYHSDSQESDIEIIQPSAGAPKQIWFTDQSLTGGKSTAASYSLPADAATTFHEYRLDWINGETKFFIDGQLKQTWNVNVPTAASAWHWNNWSNGDPKWSAGPPPVDSILSISKITMYFNTTDPVTC